MVELVQDLLHVELASGGGRCPHPENKISNTHLTGPVMNMGLRRHSGQSMRDSSYEVVCGLCNAKYYFLIKDYDGHAHYYHSSEKPINSVSIYLLDCFESYTNSLNRINKTL